MKILDCPELLDRAISAFYRTRSKKGLGHIQPSSASYGVEFDGKEYIVLVNVNEILAVYRIKTDGYLKGLKRWPQEIENT